VEAGVLLDVAELLEASVAVGAAVGFFARVDADVLDQLVVGRKRLETLLALVRLRFAPVGVAGVHLHRRFRHENLRSFRIDNFIRFPFVFFFVLFFLNFKSKIK
jgi:hypothetical protein